MILLVGLGNPGSEYASTRHNVGFMAADAFARRYSFTPFKEKFKGALAESVIQNEKVLLLKPQTYMNLSGESVRAVCDFYKIALDNVIVFHDDMDLSVGRVKVKTGGGSGGHNGIKNIDLHMGANYMRVRIGISKPPLKEQVVDFVLSKFTGAEKQILDAQIDLITENLPLLIAKKADCFMNKLQGKEKQNGI